MKAIFNEPTELTIVTGLNELEEPFQDIESFYKGEEIEFDLIDYAQIFIEGRGLVDDENLWNIQFGNGSMAFGVSKEWLTIVV